MKATFSLESAIDKGIQLLAFIPVIVWIMYPAVARAEDGSQFSGETAQVFEVNVAPVVGAENQTQK